MAQNFENILEELYEKHEQRQTGLYTLQLWYRHFIDIANEVATKICYLSVSVML